MDNFRTFRSPMLEIRTYHSARASGGICPAGRFVLPQYHNNAHESASGASLVPAGTWNKPHLASKSRDQRRWFQQGVHD